MLAKSIAGSAGEISPAKARAETYIPFRMCDFSFLISYQLHKMTSIYDNTVCDVKRQISKLPFLRSPGRVNSRLRTKTHPFYYTDWEELLKREWNKRAPPLSPLEWKEKHAKNMNAEDCCEFLMGRRCGRRRRLLFRSGYYLTIQPDGSVRGTKQKDSPYGRFTIIYLTLTFTG